MGRAPWRHAAQPEADKERWWPARLGHALTPVASRARLRMAGARLERTDWTRGGQARERESTKHVRSLRQRSK
eukprot:scaffold148899_cov28-Tisochrysis_lutea.AAC.2